MTEKSKLNYVTKMYVGRDFVRKFENDDGTVTKSYKYKFKDNDEQQYSKNFWGYENTKGASTLEEGERYTIGYVEKPNNQGDKPICAARFFGQPKDDDTPVQKTSSKQTTRQEKEAQAEKQQAEKEYDVPEGLKQFFSEIEANKEAFFEACGSSFERFSEWLSNPEDCGTDFFKSLEDVNKQTGVGIDIEEQKRNLYEHICAVLK